MNELDRLRPLIFKAGLCISLGLVLLCLQLTVPNVGNENQIIIHDEDEIFHMVRTPDVRSRPPLPAFHEPMERDVLPSEVERIEPPAILPMEIHVANDRNDEIAQYPDTVVHAINLPPIPEESESPPVLIPERWPVFGECGVKDPDKYRACSDSNLITYIRRNMHYPALARSIGIQGTAVIEFVVEKDGSVTNVQILRDPGGGCGPAAAEIIGALPSWRPGIQNDNPVRVLMRIPIVFALE